MILSNIFLKISAFLYFFNRGFFLVCVCVWMGKPLGREKKKKKKKKRTTHHLPVFLNCLKYLFIYVFLAWSA